MTIKNFLKTETGKRYAEALKGCAGNWEIMHYDGIEEYKAILEENGYNHLEVMEQLEYINATAYRPNDGGADFLEVIN